MRIATWNVNSVRARRDRLVAFLGRHAPDVLCLQELKVVDDDFPWDDVRAAGYDAAAFGQKTYNGVAILAREPPRDVVRGFGDAEDDPQARFIGGTVRGVRVYSVYVPNGQGVGSEAFDYKLRWLERLRAFLAAHHSPNEPIVVCGDFNVAPDDRDVYDPKLWENQTLCHPEERARLKELCEFGLVDVLRRAHPEGPGPYSWWDYRMLAFPKNLGLRIDLVLATAPVSARVEDARVDRDERKINKANKEDKPSDHAPVIVTLRRSDE
jgi:exodeoxyribonuclease-3